MNEATKKHPNPAREAGDLIAMILGAPVMGAGGGSLVEERAQDKHKAACIAELGRLRAYSRPPQDPEFHAVLDVAAKILRV